MPSVTTIYPTVNADETVVSSPSVAVAAKNAALAAQAAAEAARDAAQTARTNAETSETNAETAEANAETAEANAEAAAATASAAATVSTNLAALAGINGVYATKAAMDAATGIISNGDTLLVAADETHGGVPAVWTKTVGVLTYVDSYPSAQIYTFANRPDPQYFDGALRIIISDERNGIMECYSDGTYWRRVSDGRLAQSGSINYYVDSVAGNDANAGTSSGAALATIGAVVTKITALSSYRRSGLRVALKRGSVWLERFAGTAAMAGIIIEDYGTLSSNPPKLVGSDVLTNASFTKTGGYTNIYQIDVTVEIDSLAAEYPGIWVNDVRLTFAASLAACDAKPGTFYVASPTDDTTLTLYVHPPGSTNPTSDSKVYEATVRKTGLDLGLTPYAEAYNIWTTRPHTSYGSHFMGRYNIARGCRQSDGGYHNFFQRAFCEVYDNLCDGWYANGDGSTTYIAYDTNGALGDGAPKGPAWVKYVNCRAIQKYQARIAPTAITGITQASQGVVTAAAHGLANNDFVVLTGIVGMTELNGRTFCINNVTTDTFGLRVVDLVTGTATNLNTSSYTAYSSGGVVTLADFGAGSSGSDLGFYAHTDAVISFDTVEFINCEVYGASSGITTANTKKQVIVDPIFRQCFLAMQSSADLSIIKASLSKPAIINSPAIPGMLWGRSSLAGQTWDIDGLYGIINATGSFQIVNADVKFRMRRSKLVGTTFTLRTTAAGLRPNLDIEGLEIDPNGRTGSSYIDYWLDAASLTGAVIHSDYNTFPGNRSMTMGASTLTLDQWRADYGQDWLSLSAAPYTATATYDPPSLADGAGATTTVSVSGIVVGDFVRASFSNDLQGITLTAWCSSAGVASVRFQNESGGALDLASGTLTVRADKI